MSGWRESLRFQQSLSIAAKEEADRVGHPTIEVEHLFLALLVMGGPATRILAETGVELVGARQAVAAEHRERVQSLGFAAPEITPLDVIPDPGATDIVFSHAALRVVQQPISGSFDLGLLEHLLDEPGGVVAAALVRLGVDPETVRTLIRTAGPAAEAVTAPARDPDTATHTGYVPVPPDRVWDLLSDPARRAEWDALGYASFAVQPDGTVRTVAATKTPRGRRIWVSPGLVHASHAVSRTEPGSGVEWRTTFPDTPEVTAVLSIGLAPEGPGTRINLALRRGPGPRLLRTPFAGPWRWFLRLSLSGTVSSISRALR